MQNSFLLEKEDDIKSNKEPIAGILLSVQLDLLDNTLLPRNGLLLQGKYDNSSVEWGSSINYHLYRVRETFILHGDVIPFG